MAAAIKALNAKIRSNPERLPDFWGPASNFGIPIAAVMDTQKDPEIISGRMTTALLGYSTIFMRYAFAVTPKNYLLFGCHAVNFTAQNVQMYRYLNHWHMGGRERVMEDMKRKGDTLESEVRAEGEKAVEKGRDVVETGKEKAKSAVGR
ncbi:MAG: hypothetical protein M1828_001490 [Chrysothrix sp. TS-e1954]|nr:MAG: hypothetical protein M1828_001490 [Chrysothrix sp. TS-e1954]